MYIKFILKVAEQVVQMKNEKLLLITKMNAFFKCKMFSISLLNVFENLPLSRLALVFIVLMEFEIQLM